MLGDRHRLFAASSPTGPAFEGAQISCGQRATAGAIERVRIDPDTAGAGARGDRSGRRPRITGVCGSGIIDASPRCPSPGSSTPTGRSAASSATARAASCPTGARSPTCCTRATAPASTITQNDVRAIQLAKAALRAGIELLVEHAGSPEITDIRLAGAFGAHIDPYHAMVLGLVPDVPVDRVRSVGNAAGAGAVYALLSRARRTEMEAAVRDVVKIETATEPRFQELFVAAMAFPYGAAPEARAAPEAERDERRRATGRTRRWPRGAPGRPWPAPSSSASRS